MKYREIELRPNEINDQEIIGVIKKLAKQRKDSIAEFEKANRTDLVDKEKFELSVLEAYLPKQMSADEIAKVVGDVIQALGAKDVKQMGAVMKEVQARTAGTADNKTVSEIVKAKLSPS